MEIYLKSLTHMLTHEETNENAPLHTYSCMKFMGKVFSQGSMCVKSVSHVWSNVILSSHRYSGNRRMDRQKKTCAQRTGGLHHTTCTSRWYHWWLPVYKRVSLPTIICQNWFWFMLLYAQWHVIYVHAWWQYDMKGNWWQMSESFRRNLQWSCFYGAVFVCVCLMSFL